MRMLNVKAGALQLTLFIAVIIAVLLGVFILLIHSHKQLRLKSHDVILAIEASNNIFQHGLNSNIPVNDSIFLTLDDASNTIKRSYWGLFENITVRTELRGAIIEKTALIGGHNQIINRPALVLKENQQPLVIVGDALIHGDAYLPKRGIKPGQISGDYFSGAQLVYGNIFHSFKFPELPTDLSKHIHHIVHNDFYKDYEVLDLEPNGHYQNSFLNRTKLVYSSNPLNLINISLSGNIVVVSLSKITVDPSAHLNDIILIAPQITVKKHTEGTFQAFASKQILIDTSCQLNYPSAVVLLPDSSVPDSSQTEQASENQILIDHDSSIKGIVAYFGQPLANQIHQPQIIISDNAFVTGEVYCNGSLDLKGQVDGSVYSSFFIAQHEGVLYQNHLFNGQINSDLLHEKYSGLFLDQNQKTIAKWLY